MLLRENCLLQNKLLLRWVVEMAERVACIVRGESHLYDDCRCITQIRTDARTYSRLEAHNKVKDTPGSIYVEAGGSRANLVPAERQGLKYVRTAPNDTKEDNLLKARDC